VAGQVDAHAAEEVGALGARFGADDVADALFEADVPGGAARHREREGCRASHDDAARTVAEPQPGDARAGNSAVDDGPEVVPLLDHLPDAGPEVLVPVEQVQALGVGQLGIQAGRGLLGVSAGTDLDHGLVVAAGGHATLLVSLPLQGLHVRRYWRAARPAPIASPPSWPAMRGVR
jgi:hypothetical protein